MGSFWNWLKDPDNRAILGWLGGGIAVVIGGLWTAIVYVLPLKDSKPEVSPAAAVSASGGGVAVGGNVMNSTVTAGSQASPATGPGKSQSQP